MEIYNKRLKRLFLKIRADLGIDQREMARRTGISRLSRIENGKEPLTNYSFDRITKAFNIKDSDVEELSSFVYNKRDHYIPRGQFERALELATIEIARLKKANKEFCLAPSMLKQSFIEKAEKSFDKKSKPTYTRKCKKCNNSYDT